mmetsp:Transcript_1737/g.2497  ORF Transcript_1737/g.2497 Transcript_1737/m.2497 type:complete len:828 (+) Transcript_1737:125-2608(+)|eukprot:CAMPEP_0184864286 /NCGR_PEP_ID=MMETSP0580-20130426/14404_1 /TAXON_ID=1118495 /ORGANISM="Dactyliosolen fragilissimus" /LENGTH=827 /DNA_ID=CAMNT_0027363001 /DNA_START=48 /DNA_END=2531 /DNA_ORIENTATION=+
MHHRRFIFLRIISARIISLIFFLLQEEKQGQKVSSLAWRCKSIPTIPIKYQPYDSRLHSGIRGHRRNLYPSGLRNRISFSHKVKSTFGAVVLEQTNGDLNGKKVSLIGCNFSDSKPNNSDELERSFKEAAITRYDDGKILSENEVEDAKSVAKLHLDKLQGNLKNRYDIFTDGSVDDILRSIFVASKHYGQGHHIVTLRLVAQVADFLNLLLSMSFNQAHHKTGPKRGQVLNRDVLIATIFHYCESVKAQDSGIEVIARDVMRGRKFSPSQLESSPKYSEEVSMVFQTEQLPRGDPGFMYKTDYSLLIPHERERQASSETYNQNGQDQIVQVHSDFKSRLDDDTFTHLPTASALEKSKNGWYVESFNRDLGILRHVEILSKAVLPKGGIPFSTKTYDYANHIDILLIVTNDWRALAIRLIMFLHRLQKVSNQRILDDAFPALGKHTFMDNNTNLPQSIQLARETLSVYAPLAQRLGLHDLKYELEENSFKILYKRQYGTAMRFYRENGIAMNSVASHLKTKVEKIIMIDPLLSMKLHDFTVTTRIKQPYSLWKKIIKQKISTIISFSERERIISESSTIRDFIALRVIFEIKRILPNESKVSIRKREEFLCYYIQKLLLQQWPATNEDRIKDYISNPKDNGYESLHHTSSIFRYGSNWYFEVQIRSDNMHMASEFGDAAHWNYKIKQYSYTSGNHHAMKLNPSMTLKTTLPLVLKSDGGKEETMPNNDYVNSSPKSYIDALIRVRNDLRENSIFIFLSPFESDMGGKIVTLPIGSCILSLFERIHKVDMTFVLLNGHGVKSNTKLKNGDFVTVPSILYKSIAKNLPI